MQKIIPDPGHRPASAEDRFFQLSPELQAVIGFDGHILCCNPAWNARLGYSLAELEGRALTEMVHPDDLAVLEAVLSDCNNGGKLLQRFEICLRHADGSYRNLAWKTVAVPDENSIYGFARDVSELRRTEDELGFNQRLMQQVLANTPILINVKDLDDRFLYASRRMAEASGIGVEQLRGRHASEVLPGGSISRMLEHERIVRDTLQPITYRDRVLYQGAEREFLTVKFPITNASGELEAIGTIATDATDLLQVEAELREVQERFHHAFENSAIGMALVAPEGRWLQVNHALCELLGYTPEELLHLDFHDITHEEDLERDITWMDRLIEGDISSYSFEKRFLTRDGIALWALLSMSAVRNEQGRIRYFVSQIQDISERKRIQEQLSDQAIRDQLTGLHNRRHLDEVLPVEFERAERRGVSLCLAMLDIDHFKRINDAHGHKAGDVVLRAIAEHLHNTLRVTDSVFRYGGEEFLLILSEATQEGALHRLEQLREGIAQLRIEADGHDLQAPTISIGVAFSVPWCSDMDLLIRSADQALYRAKQGGRNRVVSADERVAPDA